MYLYYDRISKMFTLDAGDSDVVFLGPLVHAMLLLRSYGLTESQAREAALQAMFNMGAAVDLAIIQRIATKESRFFRRNVA
jgi:hypothetical protein